MIPLPPSLLQVLQARGYKDASDIDQLLRPNLAKSFTLPEMEKAVGRLRAAIEKEEPITIYADRDVDGLTGLAILARSLKTLGAQVHWGSPLKGRGLERDVLESLLRTGARVIILVDCGTAEKVELAWLAEQGMDVIVADHHRFLDVTPADRKPGSIMMDSVPLAAGGLSLPKYYEERDGFRRNDDPVFAWIHPGASLDQHSESPCGSVMAFKLAEALWRSFIDPSDTERLDYFLYGHLDLVALGILADRVPLTGENRALVWHGLRRLANTSKTGLASLLRFFRIKGDPITVRQASWQIIPLLNAAGRLGQPQWTVQLLLTEDPAVARECIDALLGLNTTRRRAQDVSLTQFEKAVLDQCAPDKDPVLVATARDLEPSVTGLAAQSLVQKYGKPAFLFVEQGGDLVGSGRGTPGLDLFAWVERQQEHIVKFGGHQGAVGLTIRKEDFPALREGLMKVAGEKLAPERKSAAPEATVHVEEANALWWEALLRLEPFGEGFAMPVFELTGLEGVAPRSKRSTTKVMLRRGNFGWPAELPESGEYPKRWVGVPQATPKEEFPFTWAIQPL